MTPGLPLSPGEARVSSERKGDIRGGAVAEKKRGQRINSPGLYALTSGVPLGPIRHREPVFLDVLQVIVVQPRDIHGAIPEA